MRFTFDDGEREVFLARLGLTDTADDTALAARVAEWIQEDPNTNPNGTGPGVEGQTGAPPEPTGDFVVVDVASFARMRQNEVTAQAVVEANRVRDRDELIEEAIHDGKFGPARRDHYRARYDSDPAGTTSLIASLMKNTVPLEARGADAPTEEADDTAYPTDWVPELNARIGSDNTTVATAQPQQRSRVHGES